MIYLEVAPAVIVRPGTETLTYHSAKLLPVGSVVNIEVGKKTVTGLVLGTTKKPSGFKTKPAELIIETPLPKNLVSAIKWLSEYYATPLPVVLKQTLPTGISTKRRAESPDIFEPARHPLKHKLSAEQKKAISTILAKAEGLSLLHGQTGSGKTLIYRELIRRCLAEGRSAIILTPEIGLTTQLASDLTGLTEHTYVTHSGLSQAQRHLIWQKLLQPGQPKLVIGPRSALLSPLDNIGLIILDEAHESAYKQDSSPRYQAQALASYLATQHKSRLVLGTATPRINDLYLAERTKSPVIKLATYQPEHKAKVLLADVKDRSNFSKHYLLSDELITELKSVLKQNKQALLFLNRRGTASLALCQVCGWSAVCPVCGLNLKLHHDRSLLICHQCGFNQPIPSRCPTCSSNDIIYRLPGTKQIERELTRLLPSAKVARFDADNLKGETLQNRYRDVHEGQVDIIVGTQVLSRGLDLPRLALVGVISANSELKLPDYSASERAFQLLYQVIGRVGRASHGRAIIQTALPEHPAISFGAERDYGSFYKYELQTRRALSYPPFTHLLALIFEYPSAAQAQKKANDASKNIKKKMPKITVLGPAPAFYERVGKRWRYLVVIKSPNRAKLVSLARAYRSTNCQIDIDPINLLF